MGAQLRTHFYLGTLGLLTTIIGMAELLVMLHGVLTLLQK